MTLQEITTFSTRIEWDSPIVDARNRQSPDWSLLETVGSTGVIEQQKRDIASVVSGERPSSKIAETYIHWEYSKVPGGKIEKGVFEQATLDTMGQYGLDKGLESDPVIHSIDKHGCLERRTLYRSKNVLDLVFVRTELVSNDSPDRNLTIYSSWEAIKSAPQKGWAREVLGRLNSILS